MTACDCGVAGSIPTGGALEVWPWTFGFRTAWLINKSAGPPPYNMKNIAYGMWYVILTAGTNDKSCFITGEAGTGKTTTENKLKSKLQQNQYKICTPTHKSSLLYDDAKTIYSLFNINQHNHAYLKSAVDN